MKLPRKISQHFSSDPKSSENTSAILESVNGPETKEPTPQPQAENPQLQCKFFSDLPLEIRILIYQYFIQCFGWGDSVHIVTKSQLSRSSPTPWNATENLDQTDGYKLAYVPCAAKLGDPFQISGSHYGHWPRGHLGCERIASWYTSCPMDGPQRPDSFSGRYGHLPLVLTCQRMYSEFSDHLYPSLRFDALGLAAAERFLSLSSARQLHSIRKFHMSWQTTVPIHLSPTPRKLSELDHAILLGHNRDQLWTHICQILKEMPNLQDLRISIYDVEWRPTPEDDLLGPLLDVKVSEGGRFVVELRSKETRDVREEDLFEELPETPFQIVRRQPDFDEGGNVQINAVISHGHRRRPRKLWYLCLPFFCVYYTVETLVECTVNSFRR